MAKVIKAPEKNEDDKNMPEDDPLLAAAKAVLKGKTTKGIFGNIGGKIEIDPKDLQKDI